MSEPTGSPLSIQALTDIAMVGHGHMVLMSLAVECNKNENESTAGTNGPTDRLTDRQDDYG